MVGAVAHECSPACPMWCSSSTLRTGRIEHSSNGRTWSGGHMPLLTSRGGLATGSDVSCPERQMEEAHPKRPNFRGMSTIPGGCEDQVAHAFKLQLVRHYGADVSSLLQLPIREQKTWVRSCAPSPPGIAEVMRTFLASPPPIRHITDSPAASPADAEAANQAARAAKKKGYTPLKMDPQVFSKALWVGWQELNKPPSGEPDAVLLGGILRDKFGAGPWSIWDAKLNHTTKFTIVGVNPVDYHRGMKLTRHHIARGWKISLVESKKQPCIPRAPNPDRESPLAKPTVEDDDRSSSASKNRRKKWTSPGARHPAGPSG